MRGEERQLHEHHARLLSATQVSDGDGVGVSLEAVLAELVAHGLVGLLVEEPPQVADGVLVHGQSVHEVLVVDAWQSKPSQTTSHVKTSAGRRGD